MGFDDFLSGYPQSTREVATKLRQIVREELPQATESVHTGWKIILFAEGAEICGIQPAAKGCNVHFTRGADLPDPHHLLTGTDKLLRQVRVADLAGVPEAALRELIRAARALATQPPE